MLEITKYINTCNFYFLSIDALTISKTIEKMFKEKCNSQACESNNQLREVAVGEGKKVFEV